MSRKSEKAAREELARIKGVKMRGPDGKLHYEPLSFGKVKGAKGAGNRDSLAENATWDASYDKPKKHFGLGDTIRTLRGR